MCCSLRYNSLIRVGWVERVWASREIRVFFSGWVYRLHSLSHAAQGRIVFFLSLPIVISGERLSVRYERREPSAVCFPAFPDPRPCQLLSMLLPYNVSLLRAPSILQVTGGLAMPSEARDNKEGDKKVWVPRSHPAPASVMRICRDRSQQLHGVEGQLLIECVEEMESREAVYHSLSH